MVPLLAELLSVPLPAGAAPLPPQHQKQQTLDALLAWMVAEGERQPILVMWKTCTGPTPPRWSLGLVIAQSPPCRCSMC